MLFLVVPAVLTQLSRWKLLPVFHLFIRFIVAELVYDVSAASGESDFCPVVQSETRYLLQIRIVVAAWRRTDQVKLAVINALIARLAHSMEIWDSLAELVCICTVPSILYHFGTCRTRRNVHKFLYYQIWSCSPSIPFVFDISFLWCLPCSAHLLCTCTIIFVCIFVIAIFLFGFLLRSVSTNTPLF